MRPFTSLALLTLATSATAAAAQVQLSSCRQCATDCNTQTALEAVRPGLFNLAQCWVECGSVCFPRASVGSNSALIAPSTSPSAPALKAALNVEPSSIAALSDDDLDDDEEEEDKPALPPLSIAAIVLGSLAMVTLLSGIFAIRRRRYAREAENEKLRRQSATPRSEFVDVPGFKAYNSIDLKRDSSSINSGERDGVVPTLGYSWEAYPTSPRSITRSISERNVRPSGELRRSRSVSRIRTLRASMIGPKDIPISMPATSSDEPTYEVYQCYDADSSSFFVGQLDGSDYYDEPVVVSATAPPSPKSTTPAPFEDVPIAISTTSSPRPSPPVRTRSLSVTRRPVPKYVPDEVEQDAYSSLDHGFVSAIGHASTSTHSP